MTFVMILPLARVVQSCYINCMELTPERKEQMRAATLSRRKTMDEIAIRFAAVNPEFREFAGEEPTWRKVETFIKSKYETGTPVEKILKSPRLPVAE